MEDADELLEELDELWDAAVYAEEEDGGATAIPLYRAVVERARAAGAIEGEALVRLIEAQSTVAVLEWTRDRREEAYGLASPLVDAHLDTGPDDVMVPLANAAL